MQASTEPGGARFQAGPAHRTVKYRASRGKRIAWVRSSSGCRVFGTVAPQRSGFFPPEISSKLCCHYRRLPFTIGLRAHARAVTCTTQPRPLPPAAAWHSCPRRRSGGAGAVMEDPDPRPGDRDCPPRVVRGIVEKATTPVVSSRLSTSSHRRRAGRIRRGRVLERDRPNFPPQVSELRCPVCE